MSPCLPLVALALGLPAPAPPADAGEPTVAARSRLYLRLDPSTTPDPDGRVEPAALGSFRVIGHDPGSGWRAEAGGWLAHAPGAAAHAEDAVSGDVTTLYAERRLGPAWLRLGRQWTSVGALHLRAVDGATAGLQYEEWLEVAGRAGFTVPPPGEVVGQTGELGAEVRVGPLEAIRLSAGLLHQAAHEVVPRTRWTFAADFAPGADLSAAAAATADVQQQAVVEARAEVFGRPTASLWLRGYGRHARVDQLLAADELLAVFAEQSLNELGALAEWQVVEPMRLRLDLAALPDDEVGGRARAAVDLFPAAGSYATTELTLRTDRIGRSGTLRLAGRAPLSARLFFTLETIGDAKDTADDDPDYAGFLRGGLGFEPAAGWLVYGALEGAYTPRWPGRLGGLALVEHVFGGPVRWGGAP